MRISCHKNHPFWLRLAAFEHYNLGTFFQIQYLVILKMNSSILPMNSPLCAFICVFYPATLRLCLEYYAGKYHLIKKRSHDPREQKTVTWHQGRGTFPRRTKYQPKSSLQTNVLSRQSLDFTNWPILAFCYYHVVQLYQTSETRILFLELLATEIAHMGEQFFKQYFYNMSNLLLGCLWHLTLTPAFNPRGRGKVRNDKCSENENLFKWQVFGMTSVLNEKC